MDTLCTTAFWLERGDTVRVNELSVPYIIPDPASPSQIDENHIDDEPEMLSALLSGNEIDSLEYDEIISGITELENCPICRHPIQKVACCFDAPSHGELSTQICVLCCERCAYWQYLEECTNIQTVWGDEPEDGPLCMSNQEFGFAATSKLKSFAADLPPGFSDELALFIRQHKDGWFSITPNQMEQLVKDILRSNYKHSEVLHVGGTGDDGADVLFIDDGGKKWVIQVKRREREGKAEGPAVLRELVGASILHGTQYCALFSNADYFTNAAIKTAKKFQHEGFRVELVDRGKLDRMIERLIPPRPWLPMILAMHGRNNDFYRKKFEYFKNRTSDFSPLSVAFP